MPRENAFVNVFQREKWRVQQGKKVSAYQHGTSKNAIRLNPHPTPCTIANPLTLFLAAGSPHKSRSKSMT